MNSQLLRYNTEIALETERSVDAPSQGSASSHQNHCFVVMPFGKTSESQQWFRGWYETVIHPAVVESGFTPILAATEEQPGAINDEIRRHLALDPMVVVDLGGYKPDHSPNPNVMYELGIRHAFNLPLVMMAWEGQVLPFDVSNQRMIMSKRGLLDIEETGNKITSFIGSASDGRFYRPMEAVGRQAEITLAADSLGENSLLANLVKEVEELNRRVTKQHTPRPKTLGKSVQDFLSKREAKRLRTDLVKHGMPSEIWQSVLQQGVPYHLVEEALKWSRDDWKAYISIQLRSPEYSGVSDLFALPGDATKRFASDETLIKRVAELLPAQPWPTGIHKVVAKSLDVSNGKVSRCINKLIKEGEFLPQIDGVVYEPAEDHQPSESAE